MARQENPWQFHNPTEKQKEVMAMFRAKFQELAELIEANAPVCRERSTAITRMEEAAMWANKAANQRND